MAYYDFELKTDKISGFLYGTGELGYGLDDGWSLLLQSKEGNGILNDEYYYCEHLQGRASAEKADRNSSMKFQKVDPVYYRVDQMQLLAEFIEMCHRRFDVKYEDLFKKMPISDFLTNVGTF